jgi:hypothetical protein
MGTLKAILRIPSWLNVTKAGMVPTNKNVLSPGKSYPCDCLTKVLCWLLPSLRRILLPLLRCICDVSSSSLPRRGIAFGTSVQEIGLLCMIEEAFLPRRVRCEYHQQGPCCAHPLTRRQYSQRRGSIRVVCVDFDQATGLF